MDGTVLWRKVGETTAVEFTDTEITLMQGNILTHNHPGGWGYPTGDLRRAGSSFSDADVAVLVTGRLAEIRVISPKYLHVLRPPRMTNRSVEAEYFRGRITKEGYRDIQRRILVYDDIVHHQNMLRVIDRNDLMTVEQAIADHWHQVMEELVIAWGVEYERKEWIP